MKRVVILLMAILAVAFSVDARTFVLIAGVSNYGDEDTNLFWASTSAKKFKEAMQTQTKDITLITSSNVTKSNMMEKLRAICNRAQKSDRIILYYAGHGSPGSIYLYDGMLSYDEIVDCLAGSDAGEKFCFIDSCHSGSVAKSTNTDSSWSNEVKDKNDILFMVGCRPDEYSWGDDWVASGYLTQALLKGLRGKSDTNGDHKITAIELFKYIYGDVVKRSKQKQHPQMIGPKKMHDSVVYVWR